MELPEDAILLRIFIGESDRHRNRPLYEAIVLKARELQMAGATVLRGPMGYGASSRIHTAKSYNFPWICLWSWKSWTPRTRSMVSCRFSTR